MTTTRKPRLIAYTVTGEGEKSFWTRIGAAWPHSDGEGFTIDLAAYPVNGRIVLTPPKADSKSANGGQHE